MSILDGVLVGEFALSTGGRSAVKFEIERMLRYREDRKYLMDHLDQQVHIARVSGDSQVIGVLTGGAILGALYAQEHGLPFTAFDPVGQRLLGDITVFRKHKVILIDDVITTGFTLEKAKHAIGSNYGFTVYSACVKDRRGERNE